MIILLRLSLRHQYRFCFVYMNLYQICLSQPSVKVVDIFQRRGLYTYNICIVNTLLMAVTYRYVICINKTGRTIYDAYTVVDFFDFVLTILASIYTCMYIWLIYRQIYWYGFDLVMVEQSELSIQMVNGFTQYLSHAIEWNYLLDPFNTDHAR